MQKDKERFLRIINVYQGMCNKDNHKIGTLSEKNTHMILKKFFCEDESYHEIKVGSYYADIMIDNHIYEIQTANFNKLREKLNYFLENHKVTIVYPIPHIKFLQWVDFESGEVLDKRKSPKKGSFFDAFYELYKIKFILDNPNLEIKLLLIDLLEMRNLNGWSKDKKRGSTREERFPIELFDMYTLNTSDNYKTYRDILPVLPNEFTVDDLRKKTKQTLYKARFIINVMLYLNVIIFVGKNGRKHLYKINYE